MNKKETGKIAEDIAVNFLKSQGYEILERNWQLKRLGEIDIIAKKKKILNFVEVKSLKDFAEFEPEFHFTKKKVEKIKKLANFYALKNNFDQWFISLIAIIFDENVKINYYENIQV